MKLVCCLSSSVLVVPEIKLARLGLSLAFVIDDKPNKHNYITLLKFCSH